MLIYKLWLLLECCQKQFGKCQNLAPLIYMLLCLPSYRGAAPIHWAIINGENKKQALLVFSLLMIKIDTGENYTTRGKLIVSS